MQQHYGWRCRRWFPFRFGFVMACPDALSMGSMRFFKATTWGFNQEMLDTSSHSWGFYVLNLNLRMSQQLSSEWDELPGPFTSYFGVMAWRFQAETGFWMGPQKEREQVKKPGNPGNYKHHLLQSTALILLETLFYLILLLTLYISGKHIFERWPAMFFFLQGIDINWPCIGDDKPSFRRSGMSLRSTASWGKNWPQACGHWCHTRLMITGCCHRIK